MNGLGPVLVVQGRHLFKECTVWREAGELSGRGEAAPGREIEWKG